MQMRRQDQEVCSYMTKFFYHGHEKVLLTPLVLGNASLLSGLPSILVPPSKKGDSNKRGYNIQCYHHWTLLTYAKPVATLSQSLILSPVSHYYLTPSWSGNGHLVCPLLSLTLILTMT